MGVLPCTSRAAHNLTAVAPRVTPFCRQRDKQEAFYYSEMLIARFMNRCERIFSDGTSLIKLDRCDLAGNEGVGPYTSGGNLPDVIESIYTTRAPARACPIISHVSN